jgi:hypothetical protein
MELLNREISILKLLIEEENITRAAERAGLQQPALSKILMQLEKRLERKLFSRTSDGLKPSPFAIELNRIATETELIWGQSINRLLEKESRVEGTFFIGCHPIIANIYLSETFARLQNKFPLLQLNLVLDPSRVITQKVAKGEIHFGLVANPIKHPELVTKPINQEQVYLYARGFLKTGSVVYFNPDMIDVGSFTRQLKNYKLVPISDYQVMVNVLNAQEQQGAILPSSLGNADTTLKIMSKSFYKTDIKLIYRQDLLKSFAVNMILNELREL